MKQLFFFFSMIALSLSFASCSDDEGLSMYGEKQELAGTEWECINLIAGGMDGAPISDYANILHFGDKEFSITITFWNKNEEGEEVKTHESITQGTYEYKHPKINLVFDDGTETKAWISIRNNVCFHEGNMVMEYSLLDYSK